MTLDQAFKQLTSKDGWNRGVNGVTPQYAYEIKKKLKAGADIGDDAKRRILIAAGYTRKEYWYNNEK